MTFTAEQLEERKKKGINMKEIPLTQGKVALVNDEDFEKLNKYKWCASWSGWTWYAVRNIVVNGKQTMIYMHREILNARNSIEVDHRNGNGLDNQKGNLRFCTRQQNSFNRNHPCKNNKLTVKGVWKVSNKFRAQIMVDGNSIHLGYFNVLGDADSAYRIAEEKYFGNFARGRK